MTIDLYQPLDDQPLVVRTENISRSFGSTRALARLNLSVPEGAVYVLVGPNGAGKSTTLRVLLDLVRPDSGTASIFGRSSVEDGPAVRAEIGYVPDAHDFGYPTLRVGDLLTHHAAYFPAWDTSYAESLAATLEISFSARFGNLSKGQARRVQLVQALAHRPRLLLLDEPTDGLDPLGRELVLGLLAEHLASTPTTVLVSTHLVHELEGLGDCLGAIRDGRVIAQLRRTDLASNLHRVRGQVDEGWTPSQDLRALVVHSKDSGQELDRIMWGGAEQLTARLADAGAILREVEPLNLEAATRALLSMEVPK